MVVKFKIALMVLVLATIAMTVLTVYALGVPQAETVIDENPEVWVTPALPYVITRIAPVPVGWVLVSIGWVTAGVVVVRRQNKRLGYSVSR